MSTYSTCSYFTGSATGIYKELWMDNFHTYNYTIEVKFPQFVGRCLDCVETKGLLNIWNIVAFVAIFHKASSCRSRALGRFLAFHSLWAGQGHAPCHKLYFFYLFNIISTVSMHKTS